MRFVIMGVSGSGKTTLGRKLANKLDIPFADGDDLHPRKNIRKMKSGKPLGDRDRTPWLKHCHRQLKKWPMGGVLACSALKESYREVLKQAGDIQFIYLNGDRATLLNRLKARRNHFMPETLLDSQLETLEEPEEALVIPVTLSTEQQVEMILNRLNL